MRTLYIGHSVPVALSELPCCALVMISMPYNLGLSRSMRGDIMCVMGQESVVNK